MMIIAAAVFVIGLQSPTASELQAIYNKWDKGVVSHDLKAMKSVLAKTFLATQTGGKKPLTRDEFLKQISDSWKSNGPHESSFLTVIKSIDRSGGKVRATVLETIIFGLSSNTARKVSFTSIDTWQKFNGKWQVVATEPLNPKRAK